ncbi:tRNA 4-thiouridine(8) synthase ThiI [Wenzhouxiangella sp. AB-CW3]|uniref:tRNA uracil 4-sulfurtransferase ThiI n=1 Tax=Wenzhouxiangella sp. AB-CW3 TaxID=2771012 RepID=UPI00168B12AD|nr:tRNA uracil 4-sulfurtransferase ThiI [Wenzhouxiangella sp. AB-CW3]QOC22720.1 tRNA 4-thiouridine(8) synthase ThiI [Wenzhouxiangella sp. AB-CW3]
MQHEIPQTILSLSLSGEVSTKSSVTRRSFHRRLRANLRAALDRNDLGGRIIDRRDRIDIEQARPGAAEVLSRVFGIQSVRVAYRVEDGRLETAAEQVHRLFSQQVSGGCRFAIRPRRVGHPAPGMPGTNAAARVLGQVLVDAGGQVDLDQPELRVHVEIRNDGLLLFDEPLPASGGLPLGTGGRGLALISGGFDSAVAAWRMLLRGMDLDFVVFSLAGWPQERSVRQVLEVLDERWMAGSESRLHVVDFRPVVARMRQQVHGSYWQVLLKRMMMHAADRIAHDTRAEALITGEVIGQVSSQTLANLRSIEAHVRTPVLRPLVGLNKEEIIAAARQIGTYETCARNIEFCALDGGKPITSCRPARLDRQEARIGKQLAETLAAERRTLRREDFAPVEPQETVEVDQVPDGAAVIDLCREADFLKASWPGAIHLDFDRAMEFAGNLPADRSYLLVCEFGLKSAFLAERMRRMGYRAWSFSGGARELSRHRPHRDAGAVEPGTH